MEKAFGVRAVEKAGQCHCESSLKPLGKGRAIPEGPGNLGKADMEPVCKQGREGIWESPRLVRLSREGDVANPPAAIPGTGRTRQGLQNPRGREKKGMLCAQTLARPVTRSAVVSSEPDWRELG